MPFDRHDGLVVPAKRVLDQRAVLLVLLEVRRLRYSRDGASPISDLLASWLRCGRWRCWCAHSYYLKYNMDPSLEAELHERCLARMLA